jgi:asparagine synthase (glutamine-hydrolysing)
MSHLGQPVKTFTAGHGEDDPDLVNARVVAEHFGTDHHETILHTQDLTDLLPRVLWHLDEPLGLGSSVQMYLNYASAREHTKVLLIGEGADELFGGYFRHKIFDRRLPLPGRLREDLYRRGYALADEPATTLLGRMAARAVLGRSPPMPLLRPRPRFDLPEFDGCGRGRLACALRYDQRSLPHRLLKQADAMGMSSSLELRVPYLDRPMVELASMIPDHFKIRHLAGKYILRKALEPLLPEEVVNRTKRVFQLRFNPELSDALMEICDRLFTVDSVRRRGWFDYDCIRELRTGNAGRFAPGVAQRIWMFRVWMLINSELWARLFIDREPWAEPPPTMDELIRTGSS